MHLTIQDYIVVLTLVIALFTDLKDGKIYNKLTVPVFVLGIILNTYLNQSHFKGFFLSLAGGILGLVILMFFFSVGGFGAGDLKLLGALGALKGPVFILYATIFTAFIGGLTSIVFLVKEGIFIKTLKNILFNAYLIITFGRKVDRVKFEHSVLKKTFPYSISIAMGVVFAFYYLNYYI